MFIYIWSTDKGRKLAVKGHWCAPDPDSANGVDFLPVTCQRCGSYLIERHEDQPETGICYACHLFPCHLFPCEEA